ncbi:hypothetical protein [Bdellovibrio sp. HCB337]|uniref:hypothetical protein n=1 Tax=Bdellovibrio sp. HCB337 TaxID=3394358 RepID=UPI0039A649E8
MGVMLRRMAQLFFVVFLFVSFLETSFAHSEVFKHSHSDAQMQSEQVIPEEEHAQNEEHCPFEAIHHCCHINIVLKSELFRLVAFSAGPQVFWDFNQLIKPFPFLDGPFQPPRA